MMKRVLIVQPFGIGDLLFLTPVFRALRLIPSIEKVDLLLGSRTEIVVRQNPHIDEIFSLDKDRLRSQNAQGKMRMLWKLGKRLRKNRYDLLLDYSMTRDYGFWAWVFFGIPKRVGFDYKGRGNFHSVRVKVPKGFSEKHVVDYACDLAEAAGIKVPIRFLEYFHDAPLLEKAEILLERKTGSRYGKFLAISPGGGESWGKDAHFKRWPTSFLGTFASRLAQKEKFERIFVFGGPCEKELSGELMAFLPPNALNFTGQLSLAETAALMAQCSGFAGNDGGLMHLATAIHLPVIALFGPVDPVVYGPYPRNSKRSIAVYKDDLSCRPCYQKFRYKSDCEHRACLQSFTVDDVFKFLEIHNQSDVNNGK